MRTFVELGFKPSALGGLAGNLTTEKGLFFVFYLTDDLSKLIFDYSETGKEEDFVRSSEIEMSYGHLDYEELKAHIEEALIELKVSNRASELYQAWKKEMEDMGFQF